MLKLAGEFVEGQLADHMAELDAHTYNQYGKLVVGQYMLPYCQAFTTAGFAVTADRLYAIPFVAARAMTVDRIAMSVTVLAAGKEARLGIYNSGPDGKPSSLVLDAGEVSVAGTGTKAITINQALTKGLYWLAFVSDGTPSVIRYFLFATPYGIHSTWTGPAAIVYVAHAYGVLPDPFGTALVSTSQSVYMALRLASLD